MNYNYDLIIVGGGPAGSTMALYASKYGLKVLLVDRANFPRDKVCGDAIPYECYQILQELNLFQQVLESPHARAIRNMFYSEQEFLQSPQAESNSGVLMCPRIIFDNILFQAAKASVDTYEEFYVENLLIDDGQIFGIQGRSSDGKLHEYTAKVVAGADGCSSIVAKKLGLQLHDRQHAAFATRTYYRNLSLPKNELEFHYLRECIPGYFWIFPVTPETFNVGVIIFPETLTAEKRMSSQKIHRQLESSSLLKENLLKQSLFRLFAVGIFL